MTRNASDTYSLTTQRLRRLARGIGSFVAAYWLLAGIAARLALRRPAAGCDGRRRCESGRHRRPYAAAGATWWIEAMWSAADLEGVRTRIQ
jgi:hypothetical protein